MTRQLVQSLILSRIDYCNVAFVGLPQVSIIRFQAVINAAACLVFKFKSLTTFQRRYKQWRTEHKCRPGRRPQMPPFQQKRFLSGAKNVNQLAKISDDHFWSFTQKMNIVYVTNCAAPSAVHLLPCAALNFQLFCPFLQKIVPFLT